MSEWNYVVTAHKPTNVTHSCVGNFTGHKALNLIVAKCTRIEINLVTSQGLRRLLDVPMYGRITTLELFRTHGENQDFLFVTTERYKFCVLQWDAEKNELLTRDMGDVSDMIGRPRDEGQIGIIDPDGKLIGLHLYDGWFKVIPLDSNGHIEEAFNIRLEQFQVLDIKFLYGCPQPTVAVLYQDIRRAENMIKRYSINRHLKTYEINLETRNFDDGPLCGWIGANEAEFLIPVPPPLCGVLMIKESKIVYLSTSAFVEVKIKPSIIRAYVKVDAGGSRYLLGDHDGHLHLLDITYETDKFIKVTGLKILLLGETSIASSISYVDNDVVFVGSSYGDSQLIKLNLEPDAKVPCVEVITSYVNLGPIVDFCVVDLESQGQRQVVTCSGAYKDGSLRILQDGILITQQASVELEWIKRIWSLRTNTNDNLMVVSFVEETRILSLNTDNELAEIEMEGFCLGVQTLFCHDAVHDQLVQVTGRSVRLVNATTRKLLNEWLDPAGRVIITGTANATQVLLSMGGRHLVHLKIGDGDLLELKRIQLEHDISCLDINPISDDTHDSQLAAVGTWAVSVSIFSLPGLDLITNEPLGEEIIARSVLLCTLEGISYLLCAIGDGHLLNFVLSTTSGELSNRKRVSLGTKPFTLHTFKSKNSTHVLAAADRPTIISSINGNLIYNYINMKEVRHMCPFNSAALPESLAIVKEGHLLLVTIDDIHKCHIRTIPLGELARRICHQEQTLTFGVCTEKTTSKHFVRLLDGRTFETLSTFKLELFESGCSITSCSFSDDNKAYYCVGIATVKPREKVPSKGRILVFEVKDGELVLIAEKKTEGSVYSVNAFKGKLLAAINQKIRLYGWMLRDDGSRELQGECEYRVHTQALHVQTVGDFIIVGDLMKSITLLMYKFETTKRRRGKERPVIVETGHDYSKRWMTAVDILRDDIYLGAENNLNIFTLRKNSAGTTLEVVAEYHLGEFINRFRHGPLMSFDDSQIPTIIFGTVNGVIGVIATLTQEQYVFLEKLQSNLRNVIKGVGGFTHEQWRSFWNKKETTDSRNFLDGDIIEAFLDLSCNQMEGISKAMNETVEEIRKRVEELTRLHYSINSSAESLVKYESALLKEEAVFCLLYVFLGLLPSILRAKHPVLSYPLCSSDEPPDVVTEWMLVNR